MDKDVVYTMENYSAIKRNEIVPFAEMCMDLETVIQSEVGQKVERIYVFYTKRWTLETP